MEIVHTRLGILNLLMSYPYATENQVTGKGKHPEFCDGLPALALTLALQLLWLF